MPDSLELKNPLNNPFRVSIHVYRARSSILLSRGLIPNTRSKAQRKKKVRNSQNVIYIFQAPDSIPFFSIFEIRKSSAVCRRASMEKKAKEFE